MAVVISLDLAEAIVSIVRLRRAERIADRPVRAEIASVRASLEGVVGPTVRPAQAARLLGVSQPALSRWIGKGEVAAVVTPQGRSEIPLSELIDLLEEVERESSGRPLASVLRRRRNAAEAIDVDRLLASSRRRPHRIADVHALAYHRLVAERLNEQIVDGALARVHRWRRDDRIHPRWADQWERVLALPLRQIAKEIGADTTRGRELRQTSPFAGVLTEHERRRLERAADERAIVAPASPNS